jgi:hypothetical protein
MIELKSKEQMAKAIKRAKQLKPFVRYRGWRWYEVQSSNNASIYTIHFYKPGKQKLAECNCKAGESGKLCYHIAGAVAVHLGIASMRKAA